MRTPARLLALLVCLAGVTGLISGCGSQSDGTAGRSKLPGLGPPPWTPAQVSEFLHPAYLAAQGDRGRLLVFMCMPAVDIRTGRQKNVFDCTGAYESGAKGMREVTFNEKGEVVDEKDVQSSSAVNPGQACTSRPDIEPALPDCADVQVRVPDGGLPPVDPSLYGTGEKTANNGTEPAAPMDDDGAPADDASVHAGETADDLQGHNASGETP